MVFGPLIIVDMQPVALPIRDRHASSLFVFTGHAERSAMRGCVFVPCRGDNRRTAPDTHLSESTAILKDWQVDLIGFAPYRFRYEIMFGMGLPVNARAPCHDL
jgi:hypothetical protein